MKHWIRSPKNEKSIADSRRRHHSHSSNGYMVMVIIPIPAQPGIIFLVCEPALTLRFHITVFFLEVSSLTFTSPHTTAQHRVCQTFPPRR